MTEGAAHLAIGDVLKLLQFDFPDVTISKIRFLESQGLVNPERTPSGYRRFYEDDIRRLQWVLRQQKERFLPLKVIKERLDAGEDLADQMQPTLFGDPEPPPAPVGDARPLEASAATASDAAPTTGKDSPEPGSAATEASPSASAPDTAAAEERRSSASPGAAVTNGAPSRHPAAVGTSAAGGDADSDPAADVPKAGAWLAALQEGPRRAVPQHPPAVSTLVPEGPSATFTIGEVATEAGLDEDTVHTLVDFGLIRPRVIGGQTCYDSAAIEVARAAGVFIGKGIEARHLRAYKLAAEREVTLFEQLTLPLLRQRNPASRQQALDELASLVEQGAALRSALLRQALGAHVGQP